MADRLHNSRDGLWAGAGRDVTITAVGLYTSAGLGFLTAVLIARGLGPQEFGVVAILFTFADLVLTFASVGSGAVTTRHISAFRADGKLAHAQALSKLGYAVDFASGFAAMGIVALIVAAAGSKLAGIQQYGWLAVLYSASFPLAALKGTNVAILSSWARYKQAAALDVSDKAIVLLLTGLALLLKARIPAIVVAAGIGPALAGIVGTALSGSLLRSSPDRHWSRTPLSILGPELRELLSGYAWTYLGTTFKGALAGAPVLVLGALHGPVQAGYLKLGTTVLNVSSYLEAALSRVSYPVLSSRWGRGGDLKMLRTLRTWTLRAGVPAATAILVTVPFVPLAVPLVFGPSFAPMGTGLQVLLLGAAASAAVFWLNNAYYVVGLVPQLTLLQGSWMLLTVLVSGWAGANWGYIGSASAVSIVRVGFVTIVATLVWRLVARRERGDVEHPSRPGRPV